MKDRKTTSSKGHLSEGELRAYLDNQLGEAGSVTAHIESCPKCRQHLNTISNRTRIVAGQLDHLSSPAGFKITPLKLARSRFETVLSEKENQSMSNKIFSPRYRSGWIAAALILVLAIALAFPQVKVIANNFLGLFRVEQVVFVPVDEQQVPQELGASAKFESMLSNDIKFEQLDEPQDVSNADEASALVGFPVRLFEGQENLQNLAVGPGGKATFVVNLKHIQAILDEIGRSDLRLPEALDGATVTVDVPRMVVAEYGQCDYEQARQAGYDPDQPSLAPIPACTILMQVESPEITAPPGLDLTQIGEAYLQILGMTREEAAAFSQNIDWTTTFVIPIPRYGTQYRSVPVDGVEGTLIELNFEAQPSEYMLLWVKDGIVYALSGPGNGSSALAFAESLK